MDAKKASSRARAMIWPAILVPLACLVLPAGAGIRMAEA
jgi:hypothetical protein